jgi:hypothetical protein
MIEAVDAVQHRRLSGSIRPDNCADLTFLNVERHISDGFDPAEEERDVLNAQEWGGG